MLLLQDAVPGWWTRPPDLWHPGELLLACGAVAVAELRAAVADELGYSCSAGVVFPQAAMLS